ATARGAAQGPATPALPAPGTLVPLRVVDPAWIDTTTSACVDFFQYANGAWLAHDTIPAAYASSGVGRDMADRNELVVRSAHDAAHYVTWLSQGGLGLPDRDYYTNTGPAADSLRQAYVEHVARLLTLAGERETAARAEASQVLALETELAKASLTRVQRRDPAATDHPMPIARLRTQAPTVDWA